LSFPLDSRNGFFIDFEDAILDADGQTGASFREIVFPREEETSSLGWVILILEKKMYSTRES